MILLALGMGVALAAAQESAQATSPPVLWAGCAGAITAQSIFRDDKVLSALLDPAGRRALQEAKRVPNPNGLTPAQIDGVAMSAAKKYYDEARQAPARAAALDGVVQKCMEQVSKLPRL